MGKDEINFGVLHAWITGIFGGAAKDMKLSHSIHTQLMDQRDISNMIIEVDALEIAVGRLIVERERSWLRKPRLKTIAKRHVLNQKNMQRELQREQWLREARSLVLYFGTLKENDAATAQEMLQALLPVAPVAVKVEPNLHGRTRGVLLAFKHLVGRGKQYFRSAHHG